MQRVVFAGVTMLVLLAGVALVEAGTFRGLGMLPGRPSSSASGVSADGSVVVGSCQSEVYYAEAFRWTAETGMVGLGDLPDGPFTSYASEVSADGSVVIGDSSRGYVQWDDLTFPATEPVRWTAEGGPLAFEEGLGWVGAVSGDGSVIVGQRSAGVGLPNKAAYWTPSTGPSWLDLSPEFSADHRSTAMGVSADGSVIAGGGTVVVGTGYASAHSQAFRWTAESGAVGLGFLAGCDSSDVSALSADGTTVVGVSWDSQGEKRSGFRWTAETGMVDLGYLSGRPVLPLAVSGDGSVVVGMGKAGTMPAFIWDANGGLRDLEDALTDEYGIDLLGWQSLKVGDISDDGRMLVGAGRNPSGVTEAWIAIIPEPSAIGLLFSCGLCFSPYVWRFRDRRRPSEVAAAS